MSRVSSASTQKASRGRALGSFSSIRSTSSANDSGNSTRRRSIGRAGTEMTCISSGVVDFSSNGSCPVSASYIVTPNE